MHEEMHVMSSLTLLEYCENTYTTDVKWERAAVRLNAIEQIKQEQQDCRKQKNRKANGGHYFVFKMTTVFTNVHI